MEDFFEEMANNIALISFEDVNGNVEDYELLDTVEYKDNEYVVIASLKESTEEEPNIQIIKIVEYGEEYKVQKISDEEFNIVFAVLQERHKDVL